MTQMLSTVDYVSDLQKSAPADVLRLDTGMAHDWQRKYISTSVPDDFKTVELMMITDVQWGHVCCNTKKVVEYRDWLLSEPNRFCFFGGDMIDAATCTSKGKPFDNVGSPLGQLYEFAATMMPLRHRVLGYVGGNHERHGEAGLGHSIGSLIASFLKIPYSDGQQFIDIRFGKWNPFKVSLWHGSGSSRTAGAKMQVLHRFMQQGDSHLYLCGHLHDCLQKWDWRVKRNVKGHQVGLEKICGVMSSSFLEFFGTYAEVAGLSPSDTMMARIILEPTGHWEVTLR